MGTSLDSLVESIQSIPLSKTNTCLAKELLLHKEECITSEELYNYNNNQKEGRSIEYSMYGRVVKCTSMHRDPSLGPRPSLF